MISKADIVTIVKHAAKVQRGVVERPRFVNPKREWFFIVTVTVVLFILMTGVSFIQTKLLNTVETTTLPPNKTASYDKSKATAVVEEFQSRVAQQREYEASVAANPIAQPSIASTSPAVQGEAMGDPVTTAPPSEVMVPN